MTYREATIADRAAVVGLALAFHRSTRYGRLLTVDPERVGVLFDLAFTQGLVLVADDVGVLVGFLALVLLEHTLTGERYAEEVAWWVAPAYRRGLCGPRLLTMGLDWCGRQPGCAFLTMIAPVKDDADGDAGPNVAAFYDRLGFVAVETAFMKRVG